MIDPKDPMNLGHNGKDLPEEMQRHGFAQGFWSHYNDTARRAGGSDDGSMPDGAQKFVLGYLGLLVGGIALVLLITVVGAIFQVVGFWQIALILVGITIVSMIVYSGMFNKAKAALVILLIPVVIAIIAFAVIGLAPYFYNAGTGAKSEDTSAEAVVEKRVYQEKYSRIDYPRIQAERKAEQERKAAEEKALLEQKKDELKDALPEEGLEEKYIDITWLGEHDAEEDTELVNSPIKGTVHVYQWHSRNGKNDLVYAAFVQNGKVIKITKYNFDMDYWRTDNFKPNLYAKGVKTSTPSTSEKPKYDPIDYNSGADYADDTYKWFKDHGYDDPWRAAYNYWAKHH